MVLNLGASVLTLKWYLKDTFYRQYHVYHVDHDGHGHDHHHDHHHDQGDHLTLIEASTKQADVGEVD